MKIWIDYMKMFFRPRRRYEGGHILIGHAIPVSERPIPYPPQPDNIKPPKMPEGDDPRAGREIPSLYDVPSIWECIKATFRRNRG